MCSYLTEAKITREWGKSILHNIVHNTLTFNIRLNGNRDWASNRSSSSSIRILFAGWSKDRLQFTRNKYNSHIGPERHKCLGKSQINRE
jgi:hypothetical protein